jgi:hypothetical protein
MDDDTEYDWDLTDEDSYDAPEIDESEWERRAA